MTNNHRIRTIVAVLILLGLTAGGFWPAIAKETERPGMVLISPGEFKTGEILVKFKEGLSAASMEGGLEQYNATYIRTLYGSDTDLWQVPPGAELAIIEQLTAEPFVEYAEPNYRYYALETPNDPHFNKQWAHSWTQSTAAWDITTGSAGIVIAIIDSGIDETHPDLANKIVAGYDFVNGDANPHDLNGHGSHVAGIAAAMTDNGLGVAGMDWNARIMPIQSLDYQGGGWTADIMAGIYWAYEHGAKVLNLSLGGTSYSPSMQDAINDAHGAGSLIVAAMGNCRFSGPGCPGVNPIMYPAAYNNVMAVAATGPSDVYASYSQYGSHCDIAAPGGDMEYYHDPDGIYSTMPTYPVYMTTQFDYSMNYDYAHGTSQATPHVAGLAALVWAVDPTLTPDEVQGIIEATADDLPPAGWDVDYGYGRINAFAALQAAYSLAAPILSPVSNPDGDGTYLLNWNDVPFATSYVLQEDDNVAFNSPTTRYSGADSQYQVIGQGGGLWYYRVRATNSTQASPWSNAESVVVKPAAPVLYSINNADNEDAYQIKWSSSTGATGYTLEEDDDSSFSNATIRYMGKALQYDVTGQPGGTWYYRVRAYNVGGNSPWSSTRSTTVDPPALSAPTIDSIENGDGDGEFMVAWSVVPTTPVTYTLEESGDPYFSNPMVVYTGEMTQHQVVDQSSGSWYYRVRAFGAAGKSPWSGSQSVDVLTVIYLPVVLKNSVPASSSGWTTIVSEDF